MSTVHWSPFLHFPDGCFHKVVERAALHVLDHKRIIGRHGHNHPVNGTSYMHLLEDAEPGDAALHPEAICMFMHYSCSFGHTVQGMLSSLTHFLAHGTDIASHVPLLQFEGDSHLIELNALIAEMLGRSLHVVPTGTRCVFERVHFFKCVTHVDPSQIPAVERLRAYVSLPTASLPKHIAFLKTTASAKCNNPVVWHHPLRDEPVRCALAPTPCALLPHHVMDLRALLQHLCACDTLVVSWGATAAWHLFLRPPQRCLILRLHAYGGENGSERAHRANYDTRVFGGVALSEHMYSNEMPEAEQEALRAEVRALTCTDP